MTREEAISRQKLLKAIATLDKFGCNADAKLVPYKDHYVPYISYYDVISCIKFAWPVTPQQKMGQWIQKEETDEAEPFIIWECSECNKAQRRRTKFCSSCGTKMQEVEDE